MSEVVKCPKCGSSKVDNYVTGLSSCQNCGFTWSRRYLHCEDCDMTFDFWKYDYDLESAGHAGHNVRALTKEEFKLAVESCQEAGCFDEQT